MLEPGTRPVAAPAVQQQPQNAFSSSGRMNFPSASSPGQGNFGAVNPTDYNFGSSSNQFSNSVLGSAIQTGSQQQGYNPNVNSNVNANVNYEVARPPVVEVPIQTKSQQVWGRPDQISAPPVVSSSSVPEVISPPVEKSKESSSAATATAVKEPLVAAPAEVKPVVENVVSKEDTKAAVANKREKTAKPKKAQSKSVEEEAAQASSAAGGRGWGVEAKQPVTKIEKKSLVEIQKEEAKQAALQAEVDAIAEKEQQAASVQLKMLLGVGGGGGGTQPGATVPWGGPATSQVQTAASLREIQHEQLQQAPAPSSVDSNVANSNSQWKTPHTAPVAKQSKSLVEIMNEEALLASQSNTQSASTTRAAAGSWAAKTGGVRALESNPQAWIGSQQELAAEATSAPKTSNPVVPPTVAKKPDVSNVVEDAWKHAGSSGSNTSAQAGSSGTGQVKSSSATKGKSTHTTELLEWCSSQLQRFGFSNGAEGMTLIELCLTLSSAVEIREFLADNLGSTPQVGLISISVVYVNET